MLDARILELTDRFVRNQFRERLEQLELDVGKVLDDASARGMLRSSATITEAHRLYARHIDLCILIVWTNLRRVLSVQGISPTDGLADDLKQAVKSYCEVILSEPQERLEKLIRNIGIGYKSSLDETLNHAVSTIYAEIDLFAMELIHTANQSSSSVNVNVTGNVGAVMTGPNAYASVNQSIGDEDRNALIKALDMVQNLLEHVDRLPAHPKGEIDELITEARAELQKPRPNGTKLRSALTDISTAIQTVGSLNDAYQLLKTALIPFGIPIF